MNLKQEIGGMDIYLLDQILREKIDSNDKILDAGCGKGRNLSYFINHGYDVSGCDMNAAFLEGIKATYPHAKLEKCDLDMTPYSDNQFNYIICNAVLHFAKSEEHLKNMFSELVRILSKEGTLFIRMTSNIGIESKVQALGDGVYKIPDGSTRFLLTKELLKDLCTEFSLNLLDPLKTVNVDDIRSMSTLILQKT